MILNVSQLALAFDGKPVLQDFSFALEAGETACLLGASGCGKTTALRCIAGFETPQAGSIELNGRTLFSGSLNVPAHQRRIGMVFQDYALFPHLNVADNIAFGLNDRSRSEKNQRVGELLQLIGLPDYGKHYPHQLSGGQQQRVALARALAPKPDLVLLDEPFSSLDSDLRGRLSHEVRRLLKQENISAVMVTHDQCEAFAVADKVGMMSEGRLQQWDTPAGLYRRPATAAVAAFIGEGIFIRAQADTSGAVNTALGSLEVAENLSGSLNILVRPEYLAFSARSPLTAEITSKHFGGHYFDYMLRLDNGEALHMHGSVEEDYSVGSRIGIKIVKQGKWAAFPQ